MKILYAKSWMKKKKGSLVKVKENQPTIEVSMQIHSSVLKYGEP